MARAIASVLIAIWGLACGLACVPGCSRESSGTSATKTPQVVLYSSIDDPILRPIVAAFTKETGIEVLIVGDTEATKTTGLVERLLSEKEHPRADVWWSSEPLGTIRLAREGVLEKVDLDWKARERPCGGHREEVEGPDGMRWMVAQRERVMATRHDLQTTLGVDGASWSLADPRLRGRIGMARPQFGTTRSQLASMYAEWPREAFDQWLREIKQNQMRLYDGNSAVVRALAQGEIDVGLTDTDDIEEGKREGWSIEPLASTTEMNFLSVEAEAEHRRMLRVFRTALPTTVARVRGGANPTSAKRLIDWLVSSRVEAMLHEQNAGWKPLAGMNDMKSRLVKADASAADALRAWDQVFGK